MMNSHGQSAIEWLVTHVWAILILLLACAALSYIGVFEASASPRFEGLEAVALKPVPGKVQFYSDGILVLTIVNTKPYTVRFDYVDVMPVLDREDSVRTTIDSVLKSGQLMVFAVNASNLMPVSEASSALALSVSAKRATIDFSICVGESSSGGAKESSHTVCGTAKNIEALNIEYASSECTAGQVCPCETADDCPLACQGCPGWCDSEIWCQATYGNGYFCQPTAQHPEGECVLT